jgi:carboxymethylenebutenolidase
MGDMIGIRQQAGTIQAYLATPQKVSEFRGGVIIGHELWGLTNQIMGVAERFAAQGYYAIVPDLYSTDTAIRRPSEELQKELFSSNEHTRYMAMPKFRQLIAPTQTAQFTLTALSKLESCFEYLYTLPLVHQRVAMVGFGLGGDYAFDMAMRESRLRCLVAFYGHAPMHRVELRHIKPPIMAFYGQNDKSITNELPGLIAAMKQAGVVFKPSVYAGIGHGFFNEVNAFTYNAQAASDAWQKTNSFLADRMHF